MMNQTDLQEHYPKLFDLADRITAVCEKVLQTLPITSVVQEVALYHTIRAQRLLGAIIASCQSGYASEAMVLVRSLFNLAVNIHWMVNCDVEARVERFCDFELLRKRANAVTLFKYSSLPDHIRKGYEHFLEDEADPLLRKYNLKDAKAAREWSGKSIREMTNDLGIESLYHTLYSSLSDVEHTGPHAVAQYLHRDAKGILVKWGPTDAGVEFALLEGMRLFSGTFEVLLDTCGSASPQFKELAQECITYYDEYAKANSVSD